MNPLISTNTKETIQNVAEAFDALMALLSNTDNNLCRLLTPIQDALTHAATTD